MMAFATQSDSERKVEKTFLASRPSSELLPQLLKGDSMMVSVKMDGPTISGACAAILAGVIIALEYGASPSDVRFGLAKYFVLLGYSTLPASSILSDSTSGAFNLSNQELRGLSIMTGDESRNAKTDAVHVGLDNNQSTASTLAEVLALMLLNPFINAAIVRSAVVSGIRLANRPTHVPYGIKFNRGLQCKWGELLETRLARAKGNQQPSAVNGETLTAKVQRLASEEPTNKLATAPHAKAMI